VNLHAVSLTSLCLNFITISIFIRILCWALPMVFLHVRQTASWRQEKSKLPQRRVYQIYHLQWTVYNMIFVWWISHWHKHSENSTDVY
jgi:hypothetical protein